MLRCRTVAAVGPRVLLVDYSVECDTTEHRVFKVIALMCLALCVVVPAYFVYKLRPRQQGKTDISYRVSMELGVPVDEARDAIAIAWDYCDTQGGPLRCKHKHIIE